jgi:hypothetical protein
VCALSLHSHNATNEVLHAQWRTALTEQSVTNATATATTAATTAAAAGAIHQSQGKPAHAVPAYQEAIDLYTDELQQQLEMAEANGCGESLLDDVGGESSEETDDPAKTQTVAAIQHFQQTLALLHYRCVSCTIL